MNKKQKNIINYLKKCKVGVKQTDDPHIFQIDLNKAEDVYTKLESLLESFSSDQMFVNNEQKEINKDFFIFVKETIKFIKEQIKINDEIQRRLSFPLNKWN